MFTQKSEFCQQIECLILSINQINDDSFIKDRLNQLKMSIKSCINNSGYVYIYGSRLYGIAKDESDVDLYFDTGNFNYIGKSKRSRIYVWEYIILKICIYLFDLFSSR